MITYRHIIFFIVLALSLTPWATPPLALAAGLILSLTLGHPYRQYNATATKILLQWSVVGLGFGMNLYEAAEAGKDGLIVTVITIALTMLVGYALGARFRLDKKTSYLISSGTAICGGSAIAAISPLIKADEKQMSVSLGVVFILNSIALLIFPILGYAVGLTQEQFGWWAAIAIHDTSSVVGAASEYGETALKIATVVKLERALWIIPIAFLSTALFKSANKKIVFPYFIGFFVLAMVANTFLPQIEGIAEGIATAARYGLNATLFLIGAGLSKDVVREVGMKPLFNAIVLWAVISAVSLAAVFLMF